MKENIQRIRKALKDALEYLYGQRLKGVFLFGVLCPRRGRRRVG
jgi:hypothetical protein